MAAQRAAGCEASRRSRSQNNNLLKEKLLFEARESLFLLKRILSKKDKIINVANNKTKNILLSSKFKLSQFDTIS